MLFAVSWQTRDGVTEEREKRSLKLFANWKPPAGVEFKGFYDYADCDGGIAIVETGSAEGMLESLAPWSAFFSFTVRPIVPTEKSFGLFEKAMAWRDSVR